MTDEEREETRQVMQTIYNAAVNQTRADLAGDLRELAERFVDQLHALRIELHRDLGLPPLTEAAVEEAADQPLQ